MILRRFAQNLKEQNWTAIGIEFVLLVLGVFLGIQVANWNEAQRDRQSEQQYLERLRRELAEIVPQVQSEQASLAKIEELLEAVRAFLASGQGGEALDGEHCAAVATSHIFASTIYYPPTIKELISTGRILLIRDPQARSAIMSFDQAQTGMIQLRNDVQIDRRPLARHHPELIDLRTAPEWTSARCDFGGMRGNAAFLNDFTDNFARFRGYSAVIGKSQAETLAALARSLDAGLSAEAVAPVLQDGNASADGQPEQKQ